MLRRYDADCCALFPFLLNSYLAVFILLLSASLRVALSSRKEEITIAVAAMLGAPLKIAQISLACAMQRIPVAQVVREEGYTCA